MRKILLVGAGLGMLALGGAAIAQTPPGGPDGQPPAAGDNAGPGRPGMDGRRWDGGPGRMMGMMRMMHMSQAAHFRFRRGDAAIDIKCAANEPTQACVTAAGTLLDKLNAARPSGQ